jgi:hypothetical protein
MWFFVPGILLMIGRAIPLGPIVIATGVVYLIVMVVPRLRKAARLQSEVGISDETFKAVTQGTETAKK